MYRLSKKSKLKKEAKECRKAFEALSLAVQDGSILANSIAMAQAYEGLLMDSAYWLTEASDYTPPHIFDEIVELLERYSEIGITD
jgi:hypothetical protein